MIVKIFWQPGCPRCPGAKRLGKILRKEVEVEFHNVKEVNGLAEATFFGVLSTPSIVIVRDKEKVAAWHGEVPSIKEIKKILK